MRAWVVREPGPIDGHPLELDNVPDPAPVRARSVSACGPAGCRTDLHIAEGDLAVQRHRLVPGHEVVGEVERLGPRADQFEVGDRVAIVLNPGVAPHVSAVPSWHREPLSHTTLHRLDRRRRLRRARQRPRGVRLPAARHPRRARRTAARSSTPTSSADRTTSYRWAEAAGWPQRDDYCHHASADPAHDEASCRLGGQDRRRWRWSMHAWRHHAACYQLFEIGLDPEDVAGHLGHRDGYSCWQLYVGARPHRELRLAAAAAKAGDPRG